MNTIFKNTMLTVSLLAVVFMTSCANTNRPISDSERKSFVDGCVPSCVSTATSGNPTAPKAMIDEYCKKNCECTADGIKEKMTVAQMQSYMKNQAGEEGKQVNEIIQQCMKETMTAK